MSLDSAVAVAKLRSLTTKFDEGVLAANPVYPELCTIVNSDGADEEYGFLGAMPGIREWLGERLFQSLRGAKFTLANKTWEASVQIDREHIEDDRLGMYGPVLQELGGEAAFHPDELVFDTIVAGLSSACWDGQYFFDTDHSWGDSGTQSNDLTYDASDHTAVTEAEFRAAYHAAREAMLNFKNDQGKYFHRATIRPLNNLLLVVPTELELAANLAINKQLVSSGETNVTLDKPRIMTSPYLTDASAFYLFNLDGALKPFVFQARKPIERQMKGMDDREFKGVKFMADARYNVGYLAWWKAIYTDFN